MDCESDHDVRSIMLWFDVMEDQLLKVVIVSEVLALQSLCVGTGIHSSQLVCILSENY